MPRALRSAVPDLLFDDERDARVLELGALVDEPDALSAQTPLHRVTVFLTYRCNLDCPYCKTIARSDAELEARPQKRTSFDAAAFERLLSQHRGTPLRHLHFTGGEASLVPGFVELVRRAKQAGVERLSVTTNGTLPPARYLEFIAAGLDEVRVSLDAEEPGLGAALTGRKAAWARAVETVRVLGAARASSVPFFLIVNSVVGRENRARLVELVTFLLSLGVDDLKLITNVDEKDSLGDFPEAARVKEGLDALLAKAPANAFPLLRRKLTTVFAPDAIGLTQVAPHDDWRCFIPLTERTVDATSYYPCSVYLREGGAALGPLSDAPEAQRQRSARFVKEGRCLEDPICQRYCLHCTRAYNEAANAARSGR